MCHPIFDGELPLVIKIPDLVEPWLPPLRAQSQMASGSSLGCDEETFLGGRYPTMIQRKNHHGSKTKKHLIQSWVSYLGVVS